MELQVKRSHRGEKCHRREEEGAGGRRESHRERGGRLAIGKGREPWRVGRGSHSGREESHGLRSLLLGGYLERPLW